ncbi:efflux RND transporter permease subunit [Candidatus Pyrohabitans sp.]
MEEEEVIDRLFNAIVAASKKAYPLFILSALLLSFLAFQYAQQVKMENEYKEYFPPDMEEVKVFDTIESEFGGTGMVFVLLEVDGVNVKSVLEEEVLNLMDELSEDISLIEGVTRVDTVLNLGGSRAEILEKPFEKRLEFVDKDEEYALLKIEVNTAEVPDSDLFVEKLIKVVDAANKPKGVEATLAGGLAYGYAFNKAVSSGQKSALLISAGLVTMTLLLIFRTFTGAVFPLIPVVVGVVSAFGLMHFINIPITAMTAVFGAVSIGLGIDYAVHMMHRYYEELDRGNAEALSITLRRIGRVIIATSVTTGAAFSSMLFSEMRISAEYGIISVLGIIFSALAVMIFFPSLLLLERRLGGNRKNFDGIGEFLGIRNISSVIARISGFAIRKPMVVPILLLILLLPVSLGMGKLYFLTDPNQWLPEGEPISRATDILGDEFSGTNVLYVLIEADDIRQPGIIRAMAEMQREFREVDSVYSTSSIADYLDSSENVGEIRDLIYAIPAEVRGRYVNDDYTAGVIYINTEDLGGEEEASSVLVRELQDRINYVEKPGDASYTLSGYSVLDSRLLELMGIGQERSFLVSLVLIVGILFATFRNITGVVLPLIPVLFSITATMATMGFLGMPITVVSMVTSALLLGIGIDYSIHFLARYNEERDKGLGVEDALEETSKSVGRAIFATTATTMLGFLSLISMSLTPIADFGRATAIGLLYSAIFVPMIIPSTIILKERHLANRRG